MEALTTLLTNAANTMSKKVRVEFGSLEEANYGFDKLTKGEFPVLFIMPFEVQDDIDQGTGLIQSTIPLVAYMLDFITASTNDHVTKEIDQLAVTPMRLLARNYVSQINKQKHFRDAEGNGVKSVTYAPTYAMFDAHLHGVAFRFDVPVIEGLTGCHV